MKTFILCIDALFTGDLEFMKKDPHFSFLFEHAVSVENVLSVYPTYTYPAHASIISGAAPGTHHVYANQVLTPEDGNWAWNWYYHQIEHKTVFEAFHEAGLTTCAINWPVTAGGPIDYLIPEIWCRDEDALAVVKEYSSHNLDDILESHHEYLDIADKVRQDIFTTLCAEDIIRRYDPDVMFVHLTLIDSERHIRGIHHPKVERDMRLMGDLFDRMMLAVRDTQKELPSIVVLGDHGHLNYTAKLEPNNVFEQKGWISRERLQDYRAYYFGSGFSGEVFVRDESLRPELEALFDGWRRQGLLYQWFTRADAAGLGLDGDFAYVLECGDGYSSSYLFGSALINSVQLPAGSEGLGQHGHLPTRGEKPPFLAFNPRFNGLTRVEGKKMIDFASTLCMMNGVSPFETEGRPIEEITRHFS